MRFWHSIPSTLAGILLLISIFGPPAYECFMSDSVQDIQATQSGTTVVNSKKDTKKYPTVNQTFLRYLLKAITVKLTAIQRHRFGIHANSIVALRSFKIWKPIVLDRSCALVFCIHWLSKWVKIERNNYTIIYSNDVKLETNNGILSLKNSWTGTVDIGNWWIIAGTGAITIPPGTTLTPKSEYSLGKVDPKSYELKSPEGFLKDSIQVVPSVIKRSIAKSNPVITSPKKSETEANTVLKPESSDNLVMNDGAAINTWITANQEKEEKPVDEKNEENSLNGNNGVDSNTEANISVSESNILSLQKESTSQQEPSILKANISESSSDFFRVFGINLMNSHALNWWFINRKTPQSSVNK